VAVDSFKGSISAARAARALAQGLRDARPGLAIVTAPIADGGEGTVEALAAAGFETYQVAVEGPFGDPATGLIGVRGGQAVVELASAAGLHLVDGGPNSVSSRTASTYGVGQLLEAACARGAQQVAVALGGSCTTDGGAGMIEALGGLLLDSTGSPVGRGGEALVKLHRLDLRALRVPAVTSLLAATDVDNPLLGPDGAVATFATQKGAGELDRAVLETALARWAELVSRTTGYERASTPGTGAAGGTAYALNALLGATVVSGADLVLGLLGFDQLIEPGSLVIVGEGRLDQQSLRGKGPMNVARRAVAAGGRVIAVAGINELDETELREAGIDTTYTLADLEPDSRRSIDRAAPLLREVGRSIAANRWP
jgi:glycerate kinase